MGAIFLVEGDPPFVVLDERGEQSTGRVNRVLRPRPLVGLFHVRRARMARPAFVYGLSASGFRSYMLVVV